jgi:6-phosphogluconolactonase
MFRVPLLALVLAMTTSTATAADNYWVFYGGYTGTKAGGEGIMVGTLDVKTGDLSKPELAVKVNNPSFLAIAPGGKTLYAVGETEGPEGGGVYAYRIDPATGKLTQLSKLMSGGDAPCHVVVDAAGKFAAVANYTGGSVAVFSLNDDGSLKQRTAFVQLTGKSVNPGNQEAPHAHCAAFDPSGEHVFLCDLGTDKLRVFDLDRSTGAITPNAKLPFVAFPPGTGPRHIALTPDAKTAYVCGEINSTVNVLSLDLPGGKGEVTQTLSTLPKPTPGNSTAECTLHPSGKAVYVSNRGHNSVAAFGVGGKLTALGEATAGINVPRNFAIDPTGRWMLVANQAGNDVTLFAVDGSGVPQPTGKTIATPAPVCVKFLAR